MKEELVEVDFTFICKIYIGCGAIRLKLMEGLCWRSQLKTYI